jgi:hypothetical protein
VADVAAPSGSSVGYGITRNGGETCRSSAVGPGRAAVRRLLALETRRDVRLFVSFVVTAVWVGWEIGSRL